MQNFYAPPTNPRVERFKLFLNDPFLRKDPQSTLSYNIQQYVEHVTHPERDRSNPSYSTNQNAQGNFTGQQGYNNEGFNSQIPIANRMYNDGDEKYMNELVNMLNQGINKYDQNPSNRGSLNNSGGNYGRRNDSFQSTDNQGGYYNSQEQNIPLFRVPESSIPRHNESRYIEQTRAEYPSSQNRPSDPYQYIETLEQENRKLMNQIELQNSRFRPLENENRVLRERVDTQDATVRSLEAECIQLRQELTRGGGGMFSSQRSYGGQNDGNYSDKKKLIQDNEQLVLQVSQLRREKTQAQNMLNVKENEVQQLPTLQSRLNYLESEMGKKNEAIFTLGDMLKGEKIRSAELNENFKTLETAFQQSFGTVPQLPFPNVNQVNQVKQGLDSIPRTQTMTISQPSHNLQQSTNNLQQSTMPVQQNQFQQQRMASIQQDQQQQQMMMASNIQGQQQSYTPNQQHQVMASNIQAPQQSYNQNQQQQQQAPYGVNPSVSNLKAQLEQINQGNPGNPGNQINQINQVSQGNPGNQVNQVNQGNQVNQANQINQVNQPEMGPIGMNGQQVYPQNSNQTVISPGLNNTNTPLFNNKSGNLIVQNAAIPQGQENLIQQQPLDLVGGRVPFPSINELPEAIRLSLQGSIKTLLQMNGGVTATTTTTTKSKSPTKTTTSASKSKPVSSASPQTIKLKPAI